MINFDFGKNCSGCGACYNVCPVSAISLISNDEGFLIPEIDLDKCISCGKCDKVCPHLNRKTNEESSMNDVKGVWLYASKDSEAKLASSSGAACYELSKAALKKNGVVVGCVWDEKLRAVHAVSCDENDLKKTQGSKYVQSDTGNIYKDVAEYLKSGQFVVFTGTPCQATAMNNYVLALENGKYRDSLITIAIICHGVASPMAWESYKKWTMEKEGSPLIKVNFRDKSREGYKKSYCRYEYQSGKVTYLPTYLPSSKYIEATLVYNLAMRDSCTHCDCKGINTGIDLIIGDWYAEYTGEGKLGTSCIVAFTELGKLYAENNLEGLRKFSYEKIVEDNVFIEKSIKPSVNKERFFREIEDYRYWEKVEELYPPKYKYKKMLVKMGLYGFLKKFL